MSGISFRPNAPIRCDYLNEADTQLSLYRLICVDAKPPETKATVRRGAARGRARKTAPANGQEHRKRVGKTGSRHKNAEPTLQAPRGITIGLMVMRLRTFWLLSVAL
jgi:hypothetical protein